jgi:hypothetical protein
LVFCVPTIIASRLIVRLETWGRPGARASHQISKHLLPHRTGLGADSADVATAKPLKMGLFVTITGPGIQYGIPFDTWTPTTPFQGLRRASFNAFGAFSTQTLFNGLGRFKWCACEYTAQTHPRTPRLSQKLAVFPHPAQASPSGYSLVLKFATNIHRITTDGRRQSPGLVTGPSQCPHHLGGQSIYTQIDLSIEHGIGISRPPNKLIHDPGLHLEDKGDATVESMQFSRCVAFQIGKAIKCAAMGGRDLCYFALKPSRIHNALG